MDVRDLDDGDWAVVDLDTGTVLGTNVALVPVTRNQEVWEEVTSSDTQAHAYALTYGVSLRVHPLALDDAQEAVVRDLEDNESR